MLTNHCSDASLLAFLDDELDPSSERDVARHLSVCWTCRARRQQLESTAQKLAELLDQVDYPGERWRADARRRLDNAIAAYEGGPHFASPARPHWWRWALIPAACAVAAATVYIAVGPTAAPPRAVPAPAPVVRSESIPQEAAPMLAPPVPLGKPLAVARPAAGPTAAELLEAEMRAEYALHRAGACLGEEVEVANTGARIVVRGIAETEERRSALRAMLGGTSHVDFEVLAADSLPPPAAAALPAPLAVVPPPALPLRRMLEERLGDPRAIAGFANRAVALSASLRANAWALQRLERKFPPAAVRALDGAARRFYDDMIRDHSAALARQSAALVGLLDPVFGRSEPGAVPNTVAGIAAAAEEADDLLRGLLAGGLLVGDPNEALRTLLARAAATAAAAQIDRIEARKQ